MLVIKTEVFKDEKMVFVGWSKEDVLMPGDRKFFENYWYGDKGDYEVKLKVYMGNEIKQYKKFDMIVSSEREQEDIFKLNNFRTHENFVIFDVFSNKEVQDVVIVPSEYTYGWIFEGGKIDKISANRSRTVILQYFPTVWGPTSIRLDIATEDGKYHSFEKVEMEKGRALAGIWYFITDNIKILIS